MTATTPNPRDQILLEAERDLLLEKIGYIDLNIAAHQTMLTEGAWTGSMGGHDPDFYKLRGGLVKFWKEKAATHPHPFTYCVKHLSKHVANPERLCAWLKDQALGTTSWRKGNRKSLKESAEWEPTTDELREALLAYEEAAEELGIDKTDGGSDGAGSSTDAGDAHGNPHAADGEGGSADPEAGGAGAADLAGAEAGAGEGGE